VSRWQLAKHGVATLGFGINTSSNTNWQFESMGKGGSNFVPCCLGKRNRIMAEQAPNQIPVHAGLFTWPSDSPQLIGSRCGDCNEVTFPKQTSCPCCGGVGIEEILLSRRGKIWTFTVQTFPPPAPPYAGETDRNRFEAYGVAYIELPEGVRVEARLTENDASKLEIGMEMELRIEKFKQDGEGNDLMTFAFAPVN
jgi:uncharacterized OB-fold protein